MDNRINQLSVDSSSGRQTPKDDFGAMLGRGVSRTSGALLGVASAVVPGGAILSAAVSETAGRAMGGGGSTTGQVGGTGYTAGSSGTGGASASSGLESQADLMKQNQQWTEQYLKLQTEMQQESRQFTAISNVLKVRHESAKTAINNVR